MSIDLDKLAKAIMESMQLTEAEWAQLKATDTVPEGWTDCFMDALSEHFNLEGKVIAEMLQIHEGGK